MRNKVVTHLRMTEAPRGVERVLGLGAVETKDCGANLSKTATGEEKETE